MDETGFGQNQRMKKVIEVHGSKNVWTKTVKANYLVRIMTFVSTSGYMISPTVSCVLKTFELNVLNVATMVPGSAVI